MVAEDQNINVDTAYPMRRASGVKSIVPPPAPHRGEDLEKEYCAVPIYEKSYGLHGSVPLKPSMFYAGHEQPG
jgi:hypothetical protein